MTKFLIKFTVCFCGISMLFKTLDASSDKTNLATIRLVNTDDGVPVNKKLLGTSILGWETDQGTKLKTHYKMGANYGYGVWNPSKYDFSSEPLELMRNIGVGKIRFIGQFIGWEKGIGLLSKREYKFGLHEQMRLCEIVRADPILCLQNLNEDRSYENLISYLKNNFPFVRYIEIGNESWYVLTPEEYSDKFLFYYEKFKKINPDLQLGIVGKDDEWDRKVIMMVGKKFDFIAKHYYPHGGRNNNPKQDSKKIFEDLFVKTTFTENQINATLDLMDELLKERKPIAVTEFTAWFVQEKPVPYRHCLGTALINAELIKIFLHPEYNIFSANYWNFINEYWSMIANGFDGINNKLKSPYYKRPNYYVFEMYNKHFGDILLKVDVQCDSYDASQYQPIRTLIKKIRAGTLINHNLLSGSWKITRLPGIEVQDKNGILSIDFRDSQAFNYYHATKVAAVEPGLVYKLSGFIKTDNIVEQDGVCLEVQDERRWNVTYSAAATKKITGSSDWQYVEVMYLTLPDAHTVNVIARRIGERSSLKGRAYFKDVKLEKFISEVDTKIPYLSVNVSKSLDGNKIYFMVINKHMEENITSTIDLSDFTPDSEGTAWILNGPSVDATNEKEHENIRITQKRFEIKGNPFYFTFEPHSLTAIEIVSRVSLK